MSKSYIKDLIVRLTVGLPIHARDVDWLLPVLEELHDHGTWQEGYEEGYNEACKDAENQISLLWENHKDDSRDDILIAFQDFEVVR
jgi:hypothetical protein